METHAWEMIAGAGPLVATAIHHGHAIRPELADLLAIDASTRRREEDPGTGDWTTIAPSRIVGLRSRFEVDLNRPREKAVYIVPSDAWGLRVWRTEPAADVVSQSLLLYDTFYDEARRLLESLTRQFARVVVYDLHSYNHRRDGPDAPPADPQLNPEINVGTGTMDRRRWASVVDRFLADMRRADFLDRRLDVRENVKFFGGHFSRWIHDTFPSSVCVLSIEVKKFFMDEWTGAIDARQSEAMRQALAATTAGVLKELRQVRS
jgi:N-formylglutamate amidohydrolase